MKYLGIVTVLLLLAIVSTAQRTEVHFKGKMSKIGQEKRVDAEILVDTIQAKHLYALGPVENLRGEIMVFDSKPFVAAITESGEPALLKNQKNLHAIFLVYANVQQWDTLLIKEPISSMNVLQNSITAKAFLHGTDTAKAFPFLLIGKVKQGSGHIMFKDPAVTEITPESLKVAKHINTFTEQMAQMLGFYSQHHQTVFTSQNSYVHVHYRLGNKYQAGHLDEVVFDDSVPLKLLLPKN